MELKLFENGFLKKVNRKLKSEGEGVLLMLAKRTASSGAPTFALYAVPVHKYSVGFPIQLLADVPMWYIRERVKRFMKIYRFPCTSFWSAWEFSNKEEFEEVFIEDNIEQFFNALA